MNSNDISDEELQVFRESFNNFDKDGNGHITIAELTAVMKQLGQSPTKKQIKKMIESVDLDNSGTIDFEEFLVMVSQRVNYDEELRNAFDLFDKDGSGYISSAELKLAMNNFDENLTDDEIEEMIREADIDGDGEISYEEFADMLKSK